MEEHLQSYVRSKREEDHHRDLLRIAFVDPDFPIDFETRKAQKVVRYVKHMLGPEAALFEDWDALDQTDRQMYCVAVLKEFSHDTYEEVETRLKSSNVVAREVGFDQDEIPSDTTTLAWDARF